MIKILNFSIKFLMIVFLIDCSDLTQKNEYCVQNYETINNSKLLCSLKEVQLLLNSGQTVSENDLVFCLYIYDQWEKCRKEFKNYWFE